MPAREEAVVSSCARTDTQVRLRLCDLTPFYAVINDTARIDHTGCVVYFVDLHHHGY